MRYKVKRRMRGIWQVLYEDDELGKAVQKAFDLYCCFSPTEIEVIDCKSRINPVARYSDDYELRIALNGIEHYTLYAEKWEDSCQRAEMELEHLANNPEVALWWIMRYERPNKLPQKIDIVVDVCLTNRRESVIEIRKMRKIIIKDEKLSWNRFGF